MAHRSSRCQSAPASQFARRPGPAGLGTIALNILLSLAACQAPSGKPGRDAIAGLSPDGTVDMEQVQTTYTVSTVSGSGSGMLHYHGVAYPIRIGGLGIGGVGTSTISAGGEVYKLNNLADFNGFYTEGRFGFALGDRNGGDLWMQNEAGVILHLKPKRTGLLLSVRGDTILVSLSR